jgi:hypothetical protein
MEKDFWKDDWLKVLRRFDQKIGEPLRLDICGGAACILSHGVVRSTIDIDVIAEEPSLQRFQNEIKEVEKEFGLGGGQDSWLNEGPRKAKTYLAKDYEQRVMRVQGDFEKLTIRSIGAADIVIIKLAVGAGEIRNDLRQRDINDIAKISLKEIDKDAVRKRLEEIALERPEHAERMKGLLSSIRTDIGLGKQTGNTLSALEAYLADMHDSTGLELDSQVLEMWRADIVNGETTLDNIKAMVNEIIREKEFQAQKKTENGKRPRKRGRGLSF